MLWGLDVLTIVYFENGKSKPTLPILNDIRVALEAAGAYLNEMKAQAGATNKARPPICDDVAIPPLPSKEPYDDSPV